MIKDAISVAIVTHNREGSLKRCLSSLTRQTENPTEVIVIDNASADFTKRVILSFKKSLPIRYIYESKVGIPFARNRALKESRGSIIAFIDDDCEAASGWIEEMILAHRRYPKATAIMGRSFTINPRSVFGILLQYYKDSWILMNSVENNLYILDTMNVSFKKRILEKLNILFQNLPYNMGEDLDFAKQLLSKNQKIIYWPEAKSYFKSRSAPWDFLQQRFFIGASNVNAEYRWNPKALSSKNANIPLTRNTGKELFFYQYILLVVTHRLAMWTQQLGRHYEDIKLYYDYSRLEKRPENRRIRAENEVYDKKLKLSIMIITKDRYEMLNRCLQSLVNQTKKPDQIVIVDSSSNKKSSLIKKFENILPINYIREERMGYAIQRNIAFAHATGDIVATIDDDAEATSQWCENILRSHTMFPKAIAIQGKQVSTPKFSPFAVLEQLRRDNWILKNLDSHGRISVLADNNASFKSELLRRYNIKFPENTLYDIFGGLDDFDNPVDVFQGDLQAL